jgi:single-strand DNA-binding protein
MNNYKATGRLVLDPEQRTLPNGTTVCKLRLAVKGLARGQDEVGYINVTSFGTSAEAAARVLSKGWLVAIDGRLEYHDWEAPNGAKRRDWEAIGHVEFLAAPRGETPTTAVSGEDPALAPSVERPDAPTPDENPDDAQPAKPVEELVAA